MSIGAIGRDGTRRPRAKLGEQARVWLTAFTLSLLIHTLLFGLFAWMFPEPPGVWLGGFLGFPFSRVEENGAYVWLLAPAERAGSRARKPTGAFAF